MSLLDEFGKDESNVGVIIYNAESLNKSDKNLIEIVSHDFSLELNIHEQDKNHSIKNIFTIINQVDNIKQRKLILLIDAINEALNPNHLLKEINNLIETYAYPFLKIGITSRPEAWRSIKLGITLADSFYYRSAVQDCLGFELNPFTFSQEIKSFDQDELPKVYEKYKTAYKLKTSYQKLTIEIKAIISDPLVLLMVARTFKDQSIPLRLRVDQVDNIFTKYIENLIEEGRLYSEDLEILRKEIIPVMMKDDCYCNDIPSEILESTQATNGSQLSHMLFDKGKLYNGQSPNTPFQNLSDAGIMERIGEIAEYKIVFKYERLYEYFVSEYLVSKFRKTKKTSEKYKEAIEKISSYPWLWGTLKRSLTKELIDERYNIIIELALTEDLITKDILVSSLQEYAKLEPEKAKTILREFLVFKSYKNYSIARFFIRSKYLKSAIVNARRIAVEAAFKAELTEILLEGAKNSLSSVRGTSIQCLVRLWKEPAREVNIQTNTLACPYRNLGFLSLKQLSHSILNKWGFLNFTVLGSVICISCLVWFENYQNLEVIQQLKEIWKPIFKKYLLIGKEGKKRYGIIIYFIEALILLRSGSVLASLLDSGKEVNSHLNIFELSQFFKLDNKNRKIFRDLIPYLNPTIGNLNDESVRKKVIELSLCSNVSTWFLLACIFIRHTKYAPEPTIELLQDTFNLISEKSNPPPTLILQREVFRIAINKDQIEFHPEWLAFLKESAWKVFDKHSNTFHTNHHSYYFTLTESYHYCFYRKNGYLDAEFISQMINKLKEKKSKKLYQSIFFREIPTLVSFQSLPTKLSLEILKPLILGKHGQDIQNMAIESIAIVAAFDANSVDDFIFDINLPYQIQTRIKNTSVQILGRLLANRMSTYFTESLVFNYDYGQTDFIREIFEFYVNSRSLNSWISKMLRHTLNTLNRYVD